MRDAGASPSSPDHSPRTVPYLNFGSSANMRPRGVEDGGWSMSMIHSHPVLDPNAHAKSMIDAVTGHQPSPLDSEYSSETPAAPRQKIDEKNGKSRRMETSSNVAV
jgi:hypothetical protein